MARNCENDFKTEIRDAIVEYFAENNHSMSEVGNLWEAFKVVLRGVCLSKSAGILKSIQSRLQHLERELRALERLHADMGDGALLAQILTTLSEFLYEGDREVLYLGRAAHTQWYGGRDRPREGLGVVDQGVPTP